MFCLGECLSNHPGIGGFVPDQKDTHVPQVQ